ncbi:hypothetical protein H6F87_24835 [Cyanobacteria bacterium FACHB-502]|nr:hypothetical protein [Cyanobacteria bacterium FACHB-502]
MGYPQNLLEVWNLYQLHIDSKNKPAQATRILNETRSAIMRILLRGLGYERQSVGRKMTKAEVIAAEAFMKVLSTEQLIDSRAAVELGFSILNLSQASRNTYGSRLDQFLDWGEEQPWWGKSTTSVVLRTTETKNDYCPSLRRGYGKATDNRLTDRRSVYITYQVQPKDITAALDAELQEFYHFLTDPERYDRRTEAISHSAAETYLEHIRLILGWFRLQGTPRKHLSLNLLVPKLTEDALEDLTSEQREMCWKARKSYIDTWICRYFEFLREELGSKSPKTKRFKTHALTALSKFQYRTEVVSDSGYQEIPILKTLNKYSNNVREESAKWDRLKHRVVPVEKKWPDVVEGQTALTTVRRQVAEELRSLCRPKYSSNEHLRSGSAITTSLRDYLAWSTMTDTPARRQEEPCSWRISLTCPVERPEDIPDGGFYHPLPPNQVRERDHENRIADNYLYKTYKRKGKLYPEGIWVLDIHKYKTRKRYGPQSIVVKNRQFSDGNCLYDYIERYLYGWWKPEEDENFPIYDWWSSPFMAHPGRWVSSGRAEFNPEQFSCLTEQGSLKSWLWGFFFVMPRAGNHYEDSSFKAFFSNAAHKITGKRITPHTIRDMWATWAYQVGLTDAQRESLAYAMGMDIKTMEEIYERCSPSEKRRPIEEVIDHILFGELEAEYQQSTFYLEKLAKELLELPETERLNYMQLLSVKQPE